MVSLGGCSPVMMTLSGESHMSEKSTVGMCSLQSGASLRMGSPAMRRLELTQTKALMPEYPAFCPSTAGKSRCAASSSHALICSCVRRG